MVGKKLGIGQILIRDGYGVTGQSNEIPLDRWVGQVFP